MIFITFKGTEYAIPYDRETLKINRAIDSTFDNGYFETAPIESIEGIDISRRIPRNILVRILYDEQEFIFKTGETHVQQLTFGQTIKYKHRVNLVSLAKDLTRKPMENITVTQPQGDFGTFSRSVNASDDTFSTTPHVINLTNTINTNTSKFEDDGIIELEPYTIGINISYSYFVAAFSAYTVTFNVKYNDVTIRTFVENIPSRLTFKTRRKSFNYIFQYTPSVVGNFTIEVIHSTNFGVATYNLTTSLSITSLEVIDLPVRTYAQLVDKMLARSEYVLLSREKLNITAPEQSYAEYTLYDALTLIGGNLGALVRVGGMVDELSWRLRDEIAPDIEKSNIFEVSPYEYEVGTVLKIGDKYYTNQPTGKKRREVIFEFFDNPNVFEPVGIIERMEQAELEDYVSAIELNTKNVIKPIRFSPFRGGWKSLRNIGGIGQFTTDSIGYETEDAIERPIKVLIRGIPSRNESGTITYDENVVTDITSRVLEKAQWDTLPSQANYTLAGKEQLLKNNTLYYVKGDNKIYGMSYIGEVKDRLIGQPNVTRSIYEIVLAIRSVDENERMYRVADTSKDDGGLDSDLLIEMQIEYSNITESRARLYKDDQSGFDTELIKYFNESSNVNESSAIGAYAQQIVNRLGGTKISFIGMVDTLDDVPNLGDIDNEGRVYTIIELSMGKKIRYKYTLVQDYNIISSYIGIQSRHRVEEIPSESNVVRTLRYVSKFIFTDAPQSFSTRLITPNDILASLFNETSDGITYGYLECYLSNGETKKIHMSIDSDSKGKTIELKWTMPTSYSAGIKRYSIEKNEDTIWLNLDVPYTDLFGKVNAILFALYYDTNDTLDTDKYPEAEATDGDGLFTIVNDTIDKDGREILAGLVEIPILSEHPKVRVYNGFARWNKLVEGTERVRACALEYVPVKNAIKIDLTRAYDIEVTESLTVGQMNLGFTLTDMAKGIAFYNVDTLDLLMAYIDDFDSGTYNIPIYYKIVDSAFGGGQNAVAFIVADNKVGHELIAQKYDGDIIVGQIKSSIITQTSLGLTFMSGAVASSVFEGQKYESDEHIGQVTSSVFYGVAIGFNILQNNTVGSELQATKYESGTFEGTTTADTSGVAVRPAWVIGGSSVFGDPVCNVNDDIGNVKLTTVQTGCNWNEVQTYQSLGDLTTFGVQCSTGAQKTECSRSGGVWVCTDFVGESTFEDIYETCDVKVINI